MAIAARMAAMKAIIMYWIIGVISGQRSVISSIAEGDVDGIPFAKDVLSLVNTALFTVLRHPVGDNACFAKGSIGVDGS